MRRTERPPTPLTKKTADSLSETRRAQISDAADRRLDNEEGLKASGSIAHSAAYRKKALNLIKSGSISSPMPGPSVSGHSDRMSPEVYSPLFQLANLNLPRDRVTMNAWNRVFYDTHPIVRNAINLHASYPISKINITCKNKKVQQFFMEMAEKIDLYSIVYGAALEFWKHGESVSARSYITFSDGSLKPITEVRVGDHVLTHLGNSKKVTEIFKKPVKRVLDDELKIHRVTIQGMAEPLIISGNHPILSSNRKNFICGTPSCQAKGMRVLPGKTRCSNCGKTGFKNDIMPDFEHTKNLAVKDIVYAPFSNKEELTDDVFTEDFCYLMGQWLAEGCYCKYSAKEGVRLSGIKFCSYDSDYVYSVLEPLLEDCLGHKPTTYVSRSTRFVMDKKKFDTHYSEEKRGGYAIAEFFKEHCGEYSQEKKMSELVMSLPTNLQIQLLAGFIDGDGCVDQQNNHLKLSTSSPSLANQFILMLRRAGVRPSLSRTRSELDGKYTGYYLYTVKVVANEAYSLFHGKLRTEKNDKLGVRKWCSPRSSIQDCWQVTSITKIEDITDSFSDEFMYDIEVEDDHSYVANGIAVHNCFPYAELDEGTGTWSRITILNPDYVHVKKTVIGNHTMVSLRPDATLQRLVNSTSPADLSMRKFIPKHILNYVRRGQNIPLDAFNISHLKLLSSPYDIRGTSIIVSIYKDLMLYDKLRECFDNQTEIMTSDGFKNYTEVIDSEGNLNDENLKVACFNEDTDSLEYHVPSKATVWHNKGKMIHFNGEKADCMVTPNHRMYAAKKTKKDGWGPHKIRLAESISKGNYYRFKSRADFSDSSFEDIDYVDVDGTDIPIDDYMTFAGYFVSEGCAYSAERTRGNSTWYDRSVRISQQPTSDCYVEIKNNFEKIADLIGRKLSQRIVHQSDGFSAGNPQDIWKATISDQGLAQHCIEEFGTDGKAGSYHKRIPRWILNLPPKRQEIMLKALVDGDGSVIPSSNKNGTTTAYRYCTVSKQLADDVYEMVYKCGFVPNINIVERDDRDFLEYTVLWSDGHYGNEPLVYGNPNYGGANIDEIDYDDKVWCLEVPTGLFVTRRNGKITIQGNSKFAQADGMINPLTLVTLGGEGDYRPTQSDLDEFRNLLEEAQYDKDFKIVTHNGVKIERAGFSGSTIDIGTDIEHIVTNLYAGLMTPKSLMDQESSTYASSSVGLEVLRQRYDVFRNMIKKWLERKIFAPICEIQDFFEYKDGEKRLMVPSIDFNHMNLYDMADFITSVGQFVGNQQVSLQTLHRSLGLSYEEERRRIREEMIDNQIFAKEQQVLGGMKLTELLSLDPSKSITEPPGTPPAPGGEGGIPGVEDAGGMEGLGDMGGMEAGGAPPIDMGPPPEGIM